MNLADLEADLVNWITCPRCKGTMEDPLGLDASCYADVGGCDGSGSIRKAGAPPIPGN